jgi:frataxin-like iron-binding protein CyaY
MSVAEECSNSRTVGAFRKVGNPAWFGAAIVAFSLLLLAMASQSSALTQGVGWSGNGSRDASEMPLVAASGATTFRIPQGAINDTLVEAAAQNHVTILAQLGGGGALPSNRAAFRGEVAALVGRYGVNGSFWSGHPALPAEPITTWEVWNEPNLKAIAPGEYGTFLNEVAATVHTSSLGGSPEVLFGGLLANGNLGPTSGTWQQMNVEGKGTTFNAALRYLEEAYGGFATGTTGGVPNVAGIALHPYELNEASFYTPPGGARYNRIEAFRYAVGAFHSKLVELAGSKGGGQKSLSITESGWPAEGNEWSVGEAEQATLLGQVITYAKNNEGTLGLKNFDWYNFRDASGEETEWARYCGLRANDGHFRTAWTEFQGKAGVRQWVPVAPAAATSDPSQVLETQATLNGFLNPHGLPTTYWFEYGTTPSYGNSTSRIGAGRGESDLAASATVNGLQPNTTYYYRLGTENAVGSNFGPMHSFKTPQVFVGFQANTGSMLDYQSSLHAAVDTKSGMAPGTSPSVAYVPGTGYIMAFQDWHHELWLYNASSGIWIHPGLGMAAGTSPSIAVRSDGTYVVAFQDWQKHLWVYSSASGTAFNTNLTMLEGTSPSVATNGTYYVVGFEAYNNELWYYLSGAQGYPTGMGMASGSSPSVAYAANGNYVIAFQDWQKHLWTYSTASGTAFNTNLTMREGTSPSVATNGTYYVVGFEAYNNELWYYLSGAQGYPTGMGMASGSSPSVAYAENSNYVIAFQDWQTHLWTYSTASGVGSNTEYGMLGGTSPSVISR